MAFGMLFNRLAKCAGLPNVTGYLVAGLFIGPSLWTLIPGDFEGFLPENALSSLSLISTVALGFIAFSIGGSFKWSHIRHIGGKVIAITLFQGLAAVLFVDVILVALSFSGMEGFTLPTALTLGAIAAATAPAATLMVVRQYKAKGPVTEMLLPVVALDDAVALIAFAISFAVAKTLAAGEGLSFVTMFLEPLGEIFFSLFLGAASGFVLSFVLRFFHSRQNKLMLTLTFVVGGVALAELLGLSALLLCMAQSAFLANFSGESDKLFSLTDEWTPPLYMLFFVISGAQLRLDVVPKIGLLGVLYILFRSGGKYLGARWGSAAVHADSNVKKYLGITLLPQAGVAIGLATVVAAAPGFDAYGSRIQAVILCATLFYELVGPLLTQIALEKAGEIQKAPEKQKKPETA
ncbi:MAG: cation:proton antiporter [Clostridia bacterium]|nr:cation:proton antiporter [Clostridia bacterium]